MLNIIYQWWWEGENSLVRLLILRQLFSKLKGAGGYLGVRLWKMSLNTLLVEGVMVVIYLKSF